MGKYCIFSAYTQSKQKEEMDESDTFSFSILCQIQDFVVHEGKIVEAV